ncbi:MAG: class I SAM-dependent methyltransferase [Candidatus Thermoplasmatota archaeon]|jgi:SAM-dependent methyltransferase|nr:class I SAM-dependent methyltransferase [Candidatus Thermoplasmatota archaeon]MCL5984621.1 class I SAM-dependent methyltransferase [Candidatus Thermoplasmatota archaeon]
MAEHTDTPRGHVPPPEGSAELIEMQKLWDQRGKEDPLYYVLRGTLRDRKHWTKEDFLDLGRREIRGVMEYLGSFHLPLRRERALDFGCGAGRLTQGLSPYFARVDGVDHAPAMVEVSRRLLPSESNCQFTVAQGGDLSNFETSTFDLVYSDMVLQHIPYPHALDYISEFLRILRPGGVAVFQVVLDNFLLEPIPAAWRLRALAALKKVRTGEAVNNMFGLDDTSVRSAVEKGGGRVLDVQEFEGDPSVLPPLHSFHRALVAGRPAYLGLWLNVRYLAEKPLPGKNA